MSNKNWGTTAKGNERVTTKATNETLPRTMSEITWGNLSEVLRGALKAAKDGYVLSHDERADLFQLGLVTTDHFTDISTPTTFGYSLLATEQPPAVLAAAATEGAGVLPDAFDIDGFQHAIINMDADLVMGRTITGSRVRDAEKAHEEMVTELESQLATTKAALAAAEAERDGLRVAAKQLLDTYREGGTEDLEGYGLFSALEQALEATRLPADAHDGSGRVAGIRS